jgi:hypothetical protein
MGIIGRRNADQALPLVNLNAHARPRAAGAEPARHRALRQRGPRGPRDQRPPRRSAPSPARAADRLQPQAFADRFVRRRGGRCEFRDKMLDERFD